jgi:ribosomal protein S18 acetylase RimI-like enzyme
VIGIDSEIRISEAPLDVQSFIEFRVRCGWGRVSYEVAQASLNAGLVQLSAWQADRMVGFVRVVGDGALYFYIQDMIVLEDLRGRGIGNALMQHLMGILSETVPAGGTISLMSAFGKEAFYEHFGFVCRPNLAFGAGMTFVSNQARR